MSTESEAEEALARLRNLERLESGRGLVRTGSLGEMLEEFDRALVAAGIPARPMIAPGLQNWIWRKGLKFLERLEKHRT